MAETGATRGAVSRRSYHHGDLRAALIAAATERARAHGAHAIVLREVTRDVGVTARAAYRHFDDRSRLVAAVRDVALAEMADRMQQMIDHAPGSRDPVTRAVRALAAVGEGYIDYALDQPGMFDTAFFAGADTVESLAAAPSTHPFRLLIGVLEELVSAGVLRKRDVDVSAVHCWSAVHGFAALHSTGPLSNSDPCTLTPLRRHIVDMAIAGLPLRNLR